MILGLAFVLGMGCGHESGADKEAPEVVKGVVKNLAEYTRFANKNSTQGALVYVPIYSSVFHQTADQEYLLTATLSVHNIDLEKRVEITAAAYFDTKGGLVQDYLVSPVILEPLATKQFVVPQADQHGGTGANFLVRWESETEITPPIIEAVMISTSGQQGISFLTQGTVVGGLR